VARADGKASRYKEWWWDSKDELATHKITTKVLMSTKGKILEATRMTIQEAVEAEEPNNTPSFVEILHRQGTQAGLLGIHNFAGAVYATDATGIKSQGSHAMGAGFYRLDKDRGGCCQLGRREEGNSSSGTRSGTPGTRRCKE